MHPAKALGRNKMQHGINTRVTLSKNALKVKGKGKGRQFL